MQIYSPSLQHGFLLLLFWLEQAFDFNETQFINFFFEGFRFWCKFWQLCVTLILMYFSGGLFYKIYTVLCLIFKFMTYFELILYKVWCWRFCFLFCFFSMNVHLLQRHLHLLKGLSFLHWNAFGLLLKIKWIYLYWTISGFYMSIPLLIPPIWFCEFPSLGY